MDNEFYSGFPGAEQLKKYPYALPLWDRKSKAN